MKPNSNDSNITDAEKDRIMCNALADLFDRDAAEIARDPRYAKPERAPLPIVGEHGYHIPQLRVLFFENIRGASHTATPNCS
jgi:hypothetical protein